MVWYAMPTLTPLQKRVALLVHRGKNLYDIALATQLSPRQVRRHIEDLRNLLPDYPGTARQRISLWAAKQQEAK